MKLPAVLLSASIYIYFNTVYAFANNTQADQIKNAFNNASNTANSFDSSQVKTLTGNFKDWLVSWMDGLGLIVPILTGVIVVAGLIIALITSFSRRVRGVGLGISAFAGAIFLLWLFLPTFINMFG